MSHSRKADNEEPLFQFDSYEGPVDAAAPAEPFPFCFISNRAIPNISHPSLSTPNLLACVSDQTPSSKMSERILSGSRKGQGPSQPMFIRAQTIHSSHDTFDAGSSSSGRQYFSMESMAYSPSSPLNSSSFDLQAIETPFDDIYQRLVIAGYDDPAISGSYESPSDTVMDSASGKGKAREIAPALPPLQFTPIELGYDKAAWPSSGIISPTAAPSSYGSGSGSVMESNVNTDMSIGAAEPSQSPPIIRRMPSRRRSFSTLSTRSMRALAPLKATSKTTSNLARRLMQKGKAGTSPSTPGTATPGGGTVEKDFAAGQGGCLMPRRSIQGKDVPPAMFLDWNAKFQQQVLPAYNAKDFKGKGRSYSSPYPLSALDIIPSAPTDVFKPIILAPRRFFDEMLPRELRLKVLSSLLALHEEDHARIVLTNEWSVTRASSTRSKFVGRERGIRELVKFSRVSKSWQALVFDGQLWQNVELHALPRLPASFLARLSKRAGPFVHSVDLSGHTSLLPSTLTNIVKDICLNGPDSPTPYNQLTRINFQGCAALTTTSLQELLRCSPSLQNICLKGLTAVTNAICENIGEYCPQLVSLNINRCANIDGWGIRSLITCGVAHRGHLLLKELRASGLKRVNDKTLYELGRKAPFLEVLDLSYAHGLHNSALDAFVSCTLDEDVYGETVILTSRQAGRDPVDSTRYRRRVTRLRHLNLSSCRLLTDDACSNLAHTMPRLEFLELAGIGPELHDNGLVRLLDTTPLIRKLDLEDASNISDSLMAALTPSGVGATARGRAAAPEPPQTGHALEHLVVSYAADITDEAFLALIKKCPQLTVLEADNTRISGNVIQKFISLSRERKAVDPMLVVIDCRGVGENLVKQMSPLTRPRLGWRSYQARKLGYVDARDANEDLKVGRDECDPTRVVLKSFYSWQTVDAVQAARDKRRRARRVVNVSGGSTSDFEDTAFSSGRARWWSPTGRRVSGASSPEARLEMNNDRDQCTIM